jgi:hypothetical protein
MGIPPAGTVPASLSEFRARVDAGGRAGLAAIGGER